MTFADELKALFEKYDVKMDISNDYTVALRAGDDYGNVVDIVVDPEYEYWTPAADSMVVRSYK